MSSYISTVIEPKPFNLMVVFDDIIEVVTIKAKFRISSDIETHQHYHPAARLRVSSFFNELHGCMVSSITHPITKTLGAGYDEDDDEDSDDNIEVSEIDISDDIETPDTEVEEDEDDDDDELSQTEISELSKVIAKQITNSMKTDRYLNVPLLECPTSLPSDIIIACLIYEKVTSILEVFHIDEMEFTTTNINTDDECTYIIDRETCDSVIGDVLTEFKTQLTTFLKDTRDVKFTECWWERVDLSIGDMLFVDYDGLYDDLFTPFLVDDDSDPDDIDPIDNTPVTNGNNKDNDNDIEIIEV